jgi:hypothetical protein
MTEGGQASNDTPRPCLHFSSSSPSSSQYSLGSLRLARLWSQERTSSPAPPQPLTPCRSLSPTFRLARVSVRPAGLRGREGAFRKLRGCSAQRFYTGPTQIATHFMAKVRVNIRVQGPQSVQKDP